MLFRSNSDFFQRDRVRGPLLERLLIVERDDRALVHQKPRRRNPAARRPNYQNFLPGYVHYRNFNVDRLNNANKIARIKNRNTIFDSFQSCISKW